MPGFQNDIAEQPKVLHRTLVGVRNTLGDVARLASQLKDGHIRRVVFTGMGASYYAAYPALLYLAQKGVETHLIESAELLYYWQPPLDASTLLVCISQSGRSAEIRRILDEVSDKTTVIGITNDPTSPLAQQSAYVLPLHAGKEQSVSTKTYTSTLAALYLLVCTLTGDPVDKAGEQIASAAETIDTLLPQWQQQMADVAYSTNSTRFHSFLGRGVSLASAMTGALITKESAKIPTEGMSCAQFRHGPLEVVDDLLAAYIFVGPERTQSVNLRLAADMAALGGRITLIGHTQHPVRGTNYIDIPLDTAMWTLPILEIVPVQILAAQLAVQQGFEPGDFRYITKVTSQE